MIRVPLHKGETLHSFASRLAQRNRKSLHTFTSLYRFPTHWWAASSTSVHAAVAAGVGIPAGDLALSHVGSNPRASFFSGHAVEPSILARSLRLCPACLRADIASDRHPEETLHERMAWRLDAVEVCPDHHVVLADFGARPDNIWPAMAAASAMPPGALVPATPNAFETFMAAHLQGDASLPPPFDDLEPGILAEAVEVMASSEVLGNAVGFLSAPSRVRRELRDHGLSILLDGAHGFTAFIERLSPGRRNSPHGKIHYGLNGFGPWLSRNPRRNKGALRTLAASVVAERPRMPEKRTVFTVTLEGRRHHSVFTLRQSLDIASDVIADHLARLGVEPVRTEPMSLWRTDDVVEFMGMMRGSMLLPEVSRKLGIPIKQVKALAAAGILRPIAPKAKPSDFLRVSIAEIDRFSSAISRHAVRVDAAPPGHLDLPSLYRLTPRPSEIAYRMIIENRIPSAMRSGDEPIARRVSVDRDEAARRMKWLEDGGPTLTIDADPQLSRPLIK